MDYFDNGEEDDFENLGGGGGGDDGELLTPVTLFTPPVSVSPGY